MRINRISYSVMEQPRELEALKTNKKEALPADIEKSNAAKYMKGATAYAGIISFGIKPPNNTQTIAADAIRYGENRLKEAINFIKPVKSKVDDIKKQLAEITDFLQIEGEKTCDRYGRYKIFQKNKNGQVETEFTSYNNESLSDIFVYDYDLATGNLKQKINLDNDASLSLIKEYNPQNGKLQQEINFGRDSNVIYISDYDPHTGNEVKTISFYRDGTVECVSNYNTQTWNIEKEYCFSESKKLKSIDEYNPEKNRSLLKSTYFCEDGRTVEYTMEYDFKTKGLITTYFYKDSKTVKNIEEYDPKTKLLLKSTFFSKNGLKEKETEFIPGTRDILKHTSFNKDGKIEKVTEYNPYTGKKSKDIIYYY